MQTHESLPIPSSETDAFPYAKQDELRHLQELACDKGLEVKPVGDAGYIAFSHQKPYIVDAPLILLDWDDTAAQTSKDKEQCWAELAGMGLGDDVIAYCDTLSRVEMDGEVIYEPELEMRLLSEALTFNQTGQVSLSPDVKQALQRTRQALLGLFHYEKVDLRSLA